MNRIVSSVALALVVALGGCEEDDEDVSEPEAVEPVEATDNSAEVEALREQVSELQGQLAEQQAQQAQQPPSGTQTAVVPEEVGGDPTANSNANSNSGSSNNPTAANNSGSNNNASNNNTSNNNTSNDDDDRPRGQDPVRLLGQLVEEGQRRVRGDSEDGDGDGPAPFPLPIPQPQ